LTYNVPTDCAHITSTLFDKFSQSVHTCVTGTQTQKQNSLLSKTVGNFSRKHYFLFQTQEEPVCHEEAAMSCLKMEETLVCCRGQTGFARWRTLSQRRGGCVRGMDQGAGIECTKGCNPLEKRRLGPCCEGPGRAGQMLFRVFCSVLDVSIETLCCNRQRNYSGAGWSCGLCGRMTA
jgi:hypothetical protein